MGMSEFLRGRTGRVCEPHDPAGYWTSASPHRHRGVYGGPVTTRCSSAAHRDVGRGAAATTVGTTVRRRWPASNPRATRLRAQACDSSLRSRRERHFASTTSTALRRPRRSRRNRGEDGEWYQEGRCAFGLAEGGRRVRAGGLCRDPIAAVQSEGGGGVWGGGGVSRGPETLRQSGRHPLRGHFPASGWCLLATWSRLPYWHGDLNAFGTMTSAGTTHDFAGDDGRAKPGDRRSPCPSRDRHQVTSARSPLAWVLASGRGLGLPSCPSWHEARCAGSRRTPQRSMSSDAADLATSIRWGKAWSASGY